MLADVQTRTHVTHFRLMHTARKASIAHARTHVHAHARTHAQHVCGFCVQRRISTHRTRVHRCTCIHSIAQLVWISSVCCKEDKAFKCAILACSGLARRDAARLVHDRTMSTTSLQESSVSNSNTQTRQDGQARGHATATRHPFHTSTEGALHTWAWGSRTCQSRSKQYRENLVGGIKAHV